MNPFDFIPPPSDVKHQVTVGSESITNNDDGADSDCLIRNGGAGQHSTFDHRPDQTTVSLQNTTLSTSLQLASSRTRGETGSEKEVGVLADSNEFFHHSAIGSTVDDDGGDDFRRAYDHENDDDEDSYHDLDAVMALVTASESNWNDDSRRIMSANSQLPPEPQSKRTTLSTTNEESKEEISDALRMSPSPLRHPPLPRYFASSAAVVAASEEAIVLETTTSPQVARRQQFNDDERLAESLKEEDDLLLAMKLSAYEGRGDTLGAIPTWQYGEVNQALHHQEATVVAIADHYYNVQFSSSADSRQRHNAAGTTATAEWIGQDFSSNPIVTSEAHASAQLCGQPLAEDEDLGNNGSDDGITREATVIDSAPLEKQDDVPLGYTEEARVLVDSQDADSSNDADLDRKPAALPRTSRHRNSSSRDGTDVGNLEAEVVAVQERGEVHPAEYTLEQTFQAEFVGTNSSFTVAVPSTSQTSSAVADTAAVIPNLRHTQITSTAVGPPQAIASISTSTENAMVTDSVADVVTENVINIIPDDSMIEEALVFVSDDGDVIASDRKPPPKESLNRQRDTRSSSRSSLPSIAEQDNELAFHQNNSLPVAPFRHDARVLSDAELSWFDGEHVSADEHEFHHRTQNGTLLDNNHWACEQESFAAHAVGISEANCTNESILPEHEISLAEPSFSAATVVHNDSAALMGSIAHADIVGIQQDEDIHPADLEGIFQQSASADFVGEACYPAEEILTDPACTLVGVSSVALPEAATISPIHNTFFDQTSSERKDNQTVPIVASAFLDPHQPFTSEANDNEEFSPDDIDSFESSSYSVRGTITNTTIQQPVDTQINIPRESTLRETSNTTVDSESNHTSSTQRSIASANIQMLSGSLTRGTSAVIDALFGGSPPPFVPKRARSTHDDVVIQSVSSRTLLPWSVIHQKSSGMWIATMQTNQRALDANDVTEASKSLRAFSMPSESQALSLARTWTPPRMLPFASQKHCHVCKAKFAILRRACHCRNCGVCICKDCTVTWPARMIPETYNYKNEHFVHVCISCNWLSNSFRLSLLNGNQDQSVALHATGNLNLHSPFANVKGELFYPVHCAVLGGNLNVLKFLVDENCCPIKSVRVAGIGNDSGNKYTPIVTSKGRSLLGIALENENIAVLRYLVVDKGVLLASERDVTLELLSRNLEKLLHCFSEESLLGQPDAINLPPNLTQTGSEETFSPYHNPLTNETMRAFEVASTNGHSEAQPIREESGDFGGVSFHEIRRRASARVGSQGMGGDDEAAYEECIICFDRSIDCVATPCGHQICCLVCSENLDGRCPVCSSKCSFMRIYKT